MCGKGAPRTLLYGAAEKGTLDRVYVGLSSDDWGGLATSW